MLQSWEKRGSLDEDKWGYCLSKSSIACSWQAKSRGREEVCGDSNPAPIGNLPAALTESGHWVPKEHASWPGFQSWVCSQQPDATAAAADSGGGWCLRLCHCRQDFNSYEGNTAICCYNEVDHPWIGTKLFFICLIAATLTRKPFVFLSCFGVDNHLNSLGPAELPCFPISVKFNIKIRQDQTKVKKSKRTEELGQYFSWDS